MKTLIRLFEVVPIEDYAVVVDTEFKDASKLVVGDAILFTPSSGEREIWFYKDDDGYGMGVYNKEVNATIAYSRTCKIIATIYKRIENIPLIELAENNNQELEVAMWKLANYIPNTCAGQEIIIGMQPDGRFYTNTLSCKGMYSEKDLKTAIATGIVNWQQRKELTVGGLNSEIWKILKSLQRLKSIPKQLELEITNTETNTIKPLNIIY